MSAHPGLLLVWTDIPASLEAEFNDWYNRDHIVERVLGIDGFVRGRRFRAYEGGPRYLAMYETRDASVLHCEPYLALKRDYDPRSRTIVPHFIDTRKTAGQITARAGVAEGGVMALVPLARSKGREGALHSWVADTLLPGLVARHGIVAAWYAESDAATLGSATADHPRKTDRLLDAVLAIESVSEEDLAAALDGLDWPAIEAHGGRPDVPSVRFRALFTVQVRPAAA